jgi:3-oxoacyl-[acyl-carrier-protein] synthase III
MVLQEVVRSEYHLLGLQAIKMHIEGGKKRNVLVVCKSVY